MYKIMKIFTKKHKPERWDFPWHDKHLASHRLVILYECERTWEYW